MHIALITARIDPFISPIDMDGGCVMVRNYIKSLYDFGHDIHVFTRLVEESPNNSEQLNTKARMQKQAGIGKVKVNPRLTVYRLPYTSFNSKEKTWEKQLQESASFLSNVKVYFDAQDFDVYHYFHLLSIAGWYLLDSEIPHVEKTTFSPLFLSVGRKFEYLSDERMVIEKKVLEHVPAISGQSKGELKTIRKSYEIGDEKLVKISLGVDTSIFYPKEDFESLLTNKRVILISPNSIKPQKRQLEAIEIAGELKKRGHKLLMVIMGQIKDDDYYSKILQRIKELNLEQISSESIPARDALLALEADVLFLPGKKEKELSDLIRAADLAVFPSTDEGFGLLNLDCMACGTLTVCSNLKEYGDYLIPGENAIAVDVGEGITGFIKEIEDLFGNKEKIVRMSKIAVNSSQNFSWDKLIKKQLFVYNTLFNNEPVNYTKFHTSNWVNLNEQD